MDLTSRPHTDFAWAVEQTRRASHGNIELLQSWTPDRTPRAQAIVQCQCVNCGTILERRVSLLLRGISTCHICDKSTSSQQKDIARWVRSLGVEVTLGDRTQLRPREIDIWVPSAKLGIEYHSLYWHSSPPGDSARRLAHAEKYQAAKTKGIRLMQVYEDEWARRPHAVQHMVLGALGMLLRVGARELTPAIIVAPAADRFYEKYHIQGATKATYHYALLGSTGEPLAVMSFASRRSARGVAHRDGQWELARFATALRVPGAASRLWAAFRRDHNPTGVVTYCDHRYFDGRTYGALGMEAKSLRVDYEYVWRGERWRKSFGVKANLCRLLEVEPNRDTTEAELAERIGARRLWNAGKTLFEWGTTAIEPVVDGVPISADAIRAAWDNRFKSAHEKWLATANEPHRLALKRARTVAGYGPEDDLAAQIQRLYARYLADPGLYFRDRRVEYRRRLKERGWTPPEPTTEQIEKQKEYLAAYRADPKNREKQRAYMREYNKTEKAKVKDRARNRDPERLARQRKYYYSPEATAARKARQATPEFKAKNRERQRLRREKEKAERKARPD